MACMAAVRYEIQPGRSDFKLVLSSRLLGCPVALVGVWGKALRLSSLQSAPRTLEWGGCAAKTATRESAFELLLRVRDAGCD